MREEAKARGEKEEERPASAINPLRQPSIGGCAVLYSDYTH